jgi:hypothetical protein
VAYKILGYAVWNGGKWYVKRRYTGGGAKRVAALGIIGAAVAALVVAGSRRSGS